MRRCVRCEKDVSTWDFEQVNCHTCGTKCKPNEMLLSDKLNMLLGC